jgi:WD40 repeat protein
MPLHLISPLASFTPPGTARAWTSTPHPHLPLLATASSDKTVRIYSLSDFRLHSTVSGGHKRSVRSAAWKPGTRGGESVLATGSFDASIGIWRRWDAAAGLGGGGGGDDGDASPVEFGADGSPVHGGSGGDGDDGEEEWRFSVILDGHDSEVKGVAFNAGGQLLATCSRDKTVWIWEEIDEDNFETVAVLQEHEADIKCVAWHPQEDLLASGSYDDTIRLYREDVDDWVCIAVLNGHESTVWCLAFEPPSNKSWAAAATTTTTTTTTTAVGGESWTPEQQALSDQRDRSGPRLMSCSDDRTIRIWQRKPKEENTPHLPTGQGRMPSIIRSNNIEEDWYLESQLPQVHERAIYSVSWSHVSGRVVSAGSDGKIVVYQERWLGPPGVDVDADMKDSATTNGTPTPAASQTQWEVLAELDGGHGVFEINSVCWAPRWDKGKTMEKEEIIITTADDGEVKAWTLDSQ